MKYLIGVVLLICGCESDGEYVESKVVGGAKINFYEVEYKNHKYILIEGFHRSGIEHDPDCPCMVKK